MIKLIYLPVIIVAGILQVSLFGHLRLFGTPDLLLALVVLISLSCPALWAIGLCIFAGIFKDIFSAGIFSLNTLLFPLWSVFILELNRKIRIENNYLRAALAFMVCLFQGLISALSPAYTEKPIAVGHMIRITLFTCLYTAAIVPLLFMLKDLRWHDLFYRFRALMPRIHRKEQPKASK